MLGSETGQRTDHVPLPTLSQEAVTQCFSFILPTSPCALTLFVFVSSLSPLHLFLIPSTCHATPPAAVQRHLLFHTFHPPPHCPHRHHHHSQCARQTCPTAATFATLLLCSITPQVFPSLLLPSSHRISTLLRCQRHQYPPCCHCLTMHTNTPLKPLENCLP
jgi:hypothetical protein